MTETPDSQVAPAKPARRPFGELRIDPSKAQDGVWIRHPESQDELRVRRLWCAEHIRAYEQASLDWESQHGPGSAKTAEGERAVTAVAVATGLVVDWRIVGSNEPYNATAFTAILLDPTYADLLPWIQFQAGMRRSFQVGDVAGN